MISRLLEYQEEHKSFFRLLKGFRVATTIAILIFCSWWAAGLYWIFSTAVCWIWYVRLGLRLRDEEGGT
jgi:hypothetical protein